MSRYANSAHTDCSFGDCAASWVVGFPREAQKDCGAGACGLTDLGCGSLGAFLVGSSLASFGAAKQTWPDSNGTYQSSAGKVETLEADGIVAA